MKKIKNLMLWYYMFSKRLLHRYSFLLILLLIPILIPVAKIAMSGESSILRVAIVGNGSESANEVINSLKSEKSVIKYVVYDNEDEAREAVRKQQTDVAWIFHENFDEELKEYAITGKKPVISVIEREDNISEKLSRIKLFGAVFPNLSYEMFEDFVYKNIATTNDIPKQYLARYYNTDSADGDVVKIETFKEKSTKLNDNYLTAPFRGILSILIVFAGLSGAMMFLSDQAAGMYDWMSTKKRIVPAFGLTLASVFMTSILVFLALAISGFLKNIWIELMAIILFVISATLFSTFFAMVFRSSAKLGAMTPFVILTMFILCPVFFSVDAARWISLLLPPYYYLNSINDGMYLIYMLIYNILLLGVTVIINSILNRRARNVSYLG